MKKIVLTLIHLFIIQIVFSQKLTPGFDSDEYFELLKISSQQGDSIYNPDLPLPEKHSRIYRSPVMGLDNRWELWESEDSVGVISIRGTTTNQLSWVENFFCAMVPATGKIKLSDDFLFDYKLATDKDAAVHIGWLTAVGFLGRDILPKIDSLRSKGIEDFLIIGHSQGGSVATLLAAYLENLKSKGDLASSINFKTYSSAGPKPGNLYFAYDFEALTQNGWAFNVVNTADWVPEGPFSIQTTDDYNASNPFKLVDDGLKQLPFKQRIVLSRIYKNLETPPKKANKRYQKYLGKIIGNNIQEALPGFEMPELYNSNNYVRTGRQVILYANEEYFKIFPEKTDQIWNHHMFEAYFFLLNGTIVPMDKIKSN
ncbi:MAG: lipase family protein [Crocinitomicaceae bacterium]|nr:lipase family protein [Crocinitomicaceae bacterium]